jgi:outer membrane protein OmpA-like peptidoglycan-associated protein
MANGATPSVRDAGAGTAGRALGLVGLALLVALGACNPVATWRDLTGVSKNDPNPAATPNTKNLAAGEAAPYPNLATVPPPPTQELTEAELRRLTQSLVADRTNAKYTDQVLRAGSAAAGPPPVQAAPAAGAAAPTAVTLAASPSVPAAPMPAPKAPPPIVQAAAAGARPAAGPASPAAIGAGAAKASETVTKPVTTANRAAPGAAGAPNGMVSGLRKPGQPPEPGPMESGLVSPQIPETPQPESPQPPPPPPRLAAIPAAKSSPGAPLPPPAAAPPPIGATAFQPPPPPPVMASPAPTATTMTPPAGATPAPPATATPVAEITFAAGSKGVSGGDLEALKKVAALYREHPGKLRVVGYVWVVGVADPLTTFSTALDRAHAVAAALTKTGIPAAKIAVEAAPAKAAAAGDRAEVLLEH